MNWYAAHIVLYVKWKNRQQDHFPIWEDIVLFQADSEEEAFQKADERGRLEQGDDDGSFRWDGEPAEWVFAGVRKITLCEDSTKRPSDGTEITYLEMQTATHADIENLLHGDSAPVKIINEPVEALVDQ